MELKMNVILCTDDRNGILFNGRRQSRDRAVIEDIGKITEGGRLLMNRYSDKMFAEYGSSGHLIFEDTETMLDAAGENDFCFLENVCPEHFRKKIKRIVIYRWNRHYPSDRKIDKDFLKDRKLRAREDFAGNSHEKITREIYE